MNPILRAIRLFDVNMLLVDSQVLDLSRIVADKSILHDAYEWATKHPPLEGCLWIATLGIDENRLFGPYSHITDRSWGAEVPVDQLLAGSQDAQQLHAQIVMLSGPLHICWHRSEGWCLALKA